MVETGWRAPTFWKRCLSVFNRTLSEQVDWKRQFPSITPKITRLYTIGLFLWGYVKNIVYQEKLADLRTEQHRIQVATMAEEVMLVNT
jgi:hypothetical protein